MYDGLTAEDVAIAQKELWAIGDLSWLLDDNQINIKSAIELSNSKFYVVECARRLGKSFLLCAMAVEAALKTKRQRILYAAPTTRDALEIVTPLLEQILDSCPFKVKYDKLQGKWVFPHNGSQIRLFGCDNKTKANRGRGASANLVLIDEAGFIPVLDYVLHSVVAPQTLTTRGRVILASTPSDEPEHPFTTIANKAEEGGYYVRKTIYENPRLTEEDRQKYIADDASILGFTIEEFKESDVYKREFLALRAIDTNLVVLPEWDGVLEDIPRPQFFDAYVSFDAGGVDPHALLFGYWDYKEQQLVIEDELLLRDNENTETIAEAVKKKEAFLWSVDKWDGTLRAYQRELANPTQTQSQPYLRVCDMGSGKLELRVNGVTFLPTPKTEKRQAIDAVRVLLRTRKIKIHPRCRNLARHIRTTMWLNEKQKDYRRNKNGEHGDLVDCLVYMVRNLRRTKNPHPENFGFDRHTMWKSAVDAKDTPDLLPAWRKFM